MIWSRKTSRWSTVPVIIIPVSPAMVISLMVLAKSLACSMAVLRLTRVSQMIMVFQARISISQIAAARRSQMGRS